MYITQNSDVLVGKILFPHATKECNFQQNQQYHLCSVKHFCSVIVIISFSVQ